MAGLSSFFCLLLLSSFYYQADGGHSGEISECNRNEKKVFKALVDHIRCDHLKWKGSKIITAVDLKNIPNIPKIDNPTSFRLDNQGPDSDKIINGTDRFAIQYGSIQDGSNKHFSTVHLKRSDISRCNATYLTLVKGGFRMSQELRTDNRGFWVVDGQQKTRGQLERLRDQTNQGSSTKRRGSSTNRRNQQGK